MAIDPVCGMTVDEQTAPAKAVYNGTTYYFCAPGCKRTFEKDPEAVLKGGPPGMGHAPAQMMPMRKVGPPTPSLPPQGGGMLPFAAKPPNPPVPSEGTSWPC